MEELQGTEQEDLFTILYLNKPYDENDIQITFNPTWIQSKEKHVEKDSSQKDSPQSE